LIALLALLGLVVAPSEAAYAPKNRPYRVGRYSLEVRLDVASGRFDNAVRLRLVPTKPVREIELDSRDLEIAAVEELPAGRSLRYQTFPEAESLRIDTGRDLTPGTTFEMEIRYTGRASSEPDGLSRTVDPRDPKRLPIYYTQFEATAARRFFPCDDEPYHKAETEVTAELDARYEALSNGRLLEESVRDGRRRVHWLFDRPQSTYLLNFVAGQFDHLDGTAAGVPIRIYAAPGRAEEARFSLRVIEKAMPFFNRFFGVPYPWPRYGMVGIPGFYWGGMENTTLTTMSDAEMATEDPSARLARIEIAATTVHELAHQWFGDWVTMRWWDDLWLNEAFASYMETEGSREIFGHDGPLISAVADTWELYFREEDGPKSHPIVSQELPSPEDAFDWTNYIKGRHVLRMLEYYVGERAFREGVRDYLTRFGTGNASYQDFFQSMERASGMDLRRFIDGWLKHRGYPVLSGGERWNEAEKTLTIEIRQTPAHPEDRVTYDFKLPVSFHRRAKPAYDRTVALWVNSSRSEATIPLPAKPEWVSWNPGAPALVRVRRDVSEDALQRQALEDPDALSRLSALFDLAEPWISREAKSLRPLSETAKTCLRTSLLSDPSPYVREALLSKLESAKWPRLPGDLDDAALDLSFGPKGLPADDELGRLGVQAAALSFLGKTGSAPGRARAEQILFDRSVGLDLVAASASAEAMYSDAKAIERLDRALKEQGTRGFAFRKAMRLAYASVENDAVLPKLSAVLTGPEANDETFQSTLRRLEDNEVIKNSPAGAKWLASLALNEKIAEGIRAQVIGVLDEAENPEVAPFVEKIANQSRSPRIRRLAQDILENNFEGEDSPDASRADGT